MKLIDKDLLDMEKVRADLLFNRKGDWPFHVLMTVTLVFIVGPLHLGGALGFPEKAWLIRLLPLLWLIPAGYLAGLCVYILRERSWIAKAQFTVAEDTFFGAEAIMTLPHGKYRHLREPVLHHWELHFSEHGIYRTTMAHATWSKKGNRMNCTALVKSVDAGDRFYLILDKQDKGEQKPRIVLAYPCKYFTWVD